MTNLRGIPNYLVLLTIFLTASCSGPAFPIRSLPSDPLQSEDWGIGFTRLRIADAQEDRRMASFSVSNGDEPYVILLGFRGDVGVVGSVQIIRNAYENDEWAENTRGGRTVTLPNTMSVLRFNEITNNTVIGVLAIAMESDRTPWPIINERVLEIVDRLQAAAVREIEERASIDPTDTSFLDNLHQNMIEAAIPLSTSETAATTLENLIFSGVDTDEAIGVNSMILMKRPPTQNLRLPHYIPPYFTDALGNKDYGFDTTPLIFENTALRARYLAEVRVRKLE